MATTALLTIGLLVQAFAAAAQGSRSTFGGLPRWADSALRVAGLNQRFMLSSGLNPVYVVGDLDRDGLADMVVEVKDQGSLRCGLAIVHRIDQSVRIVGAGQPVGNGSSEVSCRGGWGIQAATHSHRDAIGSPDLLYVLDRSGRSGWLAWNGQSYVWVAWDSGGT